MDYNGLIHLDYDGVDDPEQLKSEVSKLETTFCAFTSPSGKGVKVFIKTNSTLESHEESFNKLKHLYDTCGRNSVRYVGKGRYKTLLRVE